MNRRSILPIVWICLVAPPLVSCGVVRGQVDTIARKLGPTPTPLPTPSTEPERLLRQILESELFQAELERLAEDVATSDPLYDELQLLRQYRTWDAALRDVKAELEASRDDLRIRQPIEEIDVEEVLTRSRKLVELVDISLNSDRGDLQFLDEEEKP